MVGLSTFLNRVFFWSYERGTWQYDIAVGMILIFVLLTPTRWFHDQPQVDLPANAAEVALVSKNGHSEVYKVDARLLATPERIPALQNNLHTALQKGSPPLSDGRFSIRKIELIRDESGKVVAYQVEINH